MNTLAIVNIEHSIDQLDLTEQLLLIERLAHRLREQALSMQAWKNDLIAMADDKAIQAEILFIHDEFAITEMDGLAGQ